MNHPKKSLLLMMVLSLLTCLGCSKQDPTLKIGEYAPLSGATATYGQSTHRGIELAIDQINKAGGLLGRPIKLVVMDTQSKPEDAVLAATRLVNQSHVAAIIGGVPSSESLAGAPICQKYGVPMITPASTHLDVTKKGDFIFRTCYTDPFQGRVMAKYATQVIKAKKVALLIDSKSDYSMGLAQSFVMAYLNNGGQRVYRKDYSAGDVDFMAQLTAIKGTNPDLIVVPGYYGEVALIVKQARSLGITTPFLGGDGWDSEKLNEIAGSAALANCYYVNHFSPDNSLPVVKQFVEKYMNRYHALPDSLAALGYDATMILGEAIQKAHSDKGPAIRKALAKTKDFKGVTGRITINKDRNAEKTAVIIAFENGKRVFKDTVIP